MTDLVKATSWLRLAAEQGHTEAAELLILIHDPILQPGSVGEAIERIRRAGYPVVCLWGAEEGVREDDGLGLAVVENRRMEWDGVISSCFGEGVSQE